MQSNVSKMANDYRPAVVAGIGCELLEDAAPDAAALASAGTAEVAGTDGASPNHL